MCLYLFVSINIILNSYVKNANKEMLAGYADPYAGHPDTDIDAT